MNIWKNVELGEIIDLYDSRRVPLSSKERSKRQGKYPYYGASGIIDYIDDYIFDGEYLLIAEDGENLNSRKLPIEFWAKGKFWVNNHAHIVLAKKNIASTDFIRHWLLNANIAGYITGAAQPKLSQENLKRIKVKLPPLPVQKKIASILSTYDDLIENNNRRIAILEEMARRLYREWFVHFRFPGHEKVKMVESELGLIPEEWEVVKIGDELKILGGGTPKKSEPDYWDEQTANINWYTPSDLTRSKSIFMSDSGLKITELGLQKSSAKLFPPYSVMMTSRATIGVLSINTTPACTNQGFIVCVPNERVITEYIYFWIENNMTQINNIASGATFKEVRRTLFKEFKMFIPDQNTMLAFQDKVRPLSKLIETLSMKNENLKKQRDMLLPKLISGKIELSYDRLVG